MVFLAPMTWTLNVTKNDEEHRHRCEVRALIRATQEADKGRVWVRDYLADPRVSGRRENLRKDLNDQIKKGNMGRDGEWL